MKYTLLLIAIATSLQAAQPNVILFLVDDMGLMDTSVPMLADQDGKPKGYPLNDWYRTPNMGRLANEQPILFSKLTAKRFIKFLVADAHTIDGRSLASIGKLDGMKLKNDDCRVEQVKEKR
jgi:hypothetical protein